MPTIVHALITGAIGILFFLSTQTSTRRFKAEHVIVFAINGFLGPDWPKLLSPFFGDDYWESEIYLTINGFGHSITGWALESLGFAFIYFLIFLLTIEYRSTKNPPISYYHSVLLCFGGGMNHFGMDMLDGWVRIFPSQFNLPYHVGVDQLQTGNFMHYGPLYAQLSWFDDKYLLMLGFIFLFLLIWLIKTKPIKYAMIVAIIFAGLVLGMIFLVGSVIVADENDLGYALYAIIAWILPLFCCYWSFDAIGNSLSK